MCDEGERSLVTSPCASGNCENAAMTAKGHRGGRTNRGHKKGDANPRKTPRGSGTAPRKTISKIRISSLRCGKRRQHAKTPGQRTGQRTTHHMPNDTGSGNKITVAGWADRAQHIKTRLASFVVGPLAVHLQPTTAEKDPVTYWTRNWWMRLPILIRSLQTDTHLMLGLMPLDVFSLRSA